MPGPNSRRERRYARRREQILAAAARIFAEKGYRDAKIAEIAAALDIADGTIYNYFDSKREILIAILEKAKADAHLVEKAPGEFKTREDLVQALVAAYDAVMAHLPFVRALIVEAWSNDEIMEEYIVAQMASVRRPVQAFLHARIAAGAFRPVDPVLASQMMLGMVFGPIMPVLRGAAPPPSSEQRRHLAETATNLILDGLCVRNEP